MRRKGKCNYKGVARNESLLVSLRLPWVLERRAGRGGGRLLQLGLSRTRRQILALPRSSELGLSFPGTARHLSASPCPFNVTVRPHPHDCPCCPRSRVMLALACWWIDARAGLRLGTLVQKPSARLPARERGGSWCLGSPQGAVEEFFQSKGWIFVAATLKPAFKLRLSVV